MQQQDSAIVLNSHPFQENGWILSLFSKEFGKKRGLYKKKSPPLLGSLVHFTWKARLSEHLGIFQIEVIDTPVLSLLSNPQALLLFQSACIITYESLAEEHPYPQLYEKLNAFFKSLTFFEDKVGIYIMYELFLLQYLGFGLDLSKCGATGGIENLVYVSPKTGRAISKEAGYPYHDRLLSLPEFLLKDSAPSLQDLLDGLKLTGFFLKEHLLKKLPLFRQLITDKIQRELLSKAA